MSKPQACMLSAEKDFERKNLVLEGGLETLSKKLTQFKIMLLQFRRFSIC